MSVILSENDTKVIQHIELEIAKEIHRICINNGIKYSLCGGSLIGAIRHKGFIPWDDDIDIFMLREEYDKFLLACNEELDKRFVIANYENTPEIGEPFTKIMMKDTVMREEFIANTKAPDGVFVDVFPIDGCPESRLLRLVHCFRNYVLKKQILIKSGYNFNKKGIIKIIYIIIDKFTFNKKRDLVKKYRINQIKYSNQKNKYVVSLCGNYGYKTEMLPRKCFDKYILTDFEEYKFMIIKEYDSILKHYYGDYMQLPPVEKRVNKHSVAKLDLSSYKE